MERLNSNIRSYNSTDDTEIKRLDKYFFATKQICFLKKVAGSSKVNIKLL